MEEIATKLVEEQSDKNVQSKKSVSNQEDDKQMKSFRNPPEGKQNILKNILTKNAIQRQNSEGNDSESKSVTQRDSVVDEKREKKKGIFQEYQERWSKNNKNIFRKLIIWRVGDDGKIEDQLKLMITYLTIIFTLILFISGSITSYSFNYTNKATIEDNILNQARNILGNSIMQYSNQTEEVFAGYEYIVTYLSDIFLAKLGVSNKLIDFDTIESFPLVGPGKMHFRTDPQSQCEIYTGSALEFDTISLECTDWYEYDPTAVPGNVKDIYQGVFPTSQLIDSFDVLNYILEEQFMDYFTTNIQNIYFGIEQHMTMIMYPGLYLGGLSKYNMYIRPWYENTRKLHLSATDNKVYRVVTKPYADAILNSKVVTLSRSIVLPNDSDTKKRYEVGKGQFLGVASVDIVLKNFQSMFEDLHFYDTGYFMMVDYNGYPINEPAQFKKWITNDGQIQISDKVDININMLLSASDWEKIQLGKGADDSGYLIMETTTLQNLEIIIASMVNSNSYYPQQGMINLIFVPKKEIYGEIERQNDKNFKNLLISSFVAFGSFFILTIICSYLVKKMMGKMVQSITELNQSALNLIDKQDASPTQPRENPLLNQSSLQRNEGNKVRKEVMQTLDRIQKRAQSQTIQQLVKGFQNQLQGVSQLGRGEQNILKNTKSGLIFDKGEYSNTSVIHYVEPLINYINSNIKDIGVEQDMNAQTTVSERINVINSSNAYHTNQIFTEGEDDKLSPDSKLKFILRKFQSNTLQQTINMQTQEFIDTTNED